MTRVEYASGQRPRRVVAGEGMLVAMETFQHDGIEFEAGVDRVSPHHPALKDSRVRSRFVPCESQRGRAIESHRGKVWKLTTSRRVDTSPPWQLVEER